MTEPLDSSASPIKLTVLVSAGSRWPLLSAQARCLDLLLVECGADFEIIAYDGSPTPAPVVLVETLPPSVRYIHSPEACATAEETLAAGLDCCRGEYVWLLSEDDGVEPAGLRELLKIIDRGDDDILVFNARHGRDDRLADDGAYVAERARWGIYQGELRCAVATFVERTGFLGGLCAISTVVVRRSAASAARLRTYVSIAPIYAQVAWLIEIGKDRRFVFVNRPLVVGRERRAEGDEDPLRPSPGIQASGCSHAVGIGMRLRILDALITRGALTLAQARRISEGGHGARSHAASRLACDVLEQVGEIAETVPIEDLAQAVTWLGRLLPSSIFLHALLDDVVAFLAEHGGCLVRIEQDSRYDQAVRATARDLRGRAAWWRQAIGDAAWYAPYYVETYRLYDIFDFGDDWVAAQVGFDGLAQALEVIDLPSAPPAFLRASTYQALRDLVENQPFKPEVIEALRADRGAKSDHVPIRRPSIAVMGPEPFTREGETSRLTAALRQRDEELAGIYASMSWRLTAWLRLPASLMRPSESCSVQAMAPPLEMGKRLDLGHEDADAFLPQGFSTAEGWGRWTDGRIAIFHCRHTARKAAGLLEVWLDMLWDRGATQVFTVGVSINGGRRRSMALRSGQTLRASVAARAMAAPQLEVAFHIADPKRREEAPADEVRALGLGVSALRLSFVDDLMSMT